ncbi:MAG: hypothetical protein Q8S32_14590 [Burkholderiaceae bacterium]|nr:hypothetical protein [Burkholderiaceae bacterium]
MTPTKTTPAQYSHPDGYTVGYSDWHLICIGEDDTTAFIPIGSRGLIDLGLKLAALGMAQLGGTA